MKTTRTFYSIVTMITLLLLIGCEKDGDHIFEKDQMIGQWKAYELVVDGEVFTDFALFNTFSTAIEFTENGYLLFIAGDKGNPNPESFQEWEIQGETLMLFNRDKELWITVKIEKVSESELWLSYTENNKGNLLKFKKI